MVPGSTVNIVAKLKFAHEIVSLLIMRFEKKINIIIICKVQENTDEMRASPEVRWMRLFFS